MEADLQRFYGLDYRGRWRGDLTLRRIYNLLTYLPTEAAVTRLVRGPQWTVEAHLLDDLRLTLVGKKGKPHPSRPKPKRRPVTDARRKKLAAARRRAAKRRADVAAGLIT